MEREKYMIKLQNSMGYRQRNVSTMFLKCKVQYWGVMRDEMRFYKVSRDLPEHEMSWISAKGHKLYYEDN